MPLASRAQTSKFADYFEKLKQDPGALRTFLNKMPKGGELHSHLSGAIPFERLFDVATRHKYRVVFRLDNGYVCGFARPELDREWKDPPCKTNLVTKSVKDLSTEERNKLRDAATMDLNDTERGEDSEFAEFNRVFDRLDALTDNADVMPELVQEVMDQAAANRVSYLELRVNPIGRKDSNGKPVKIEELVARLKAAVADKNRQLGVSRAVLVNFVIGLNRQNPNSSGSITDLRPIACTSECPSRLRQAYFLASRRYSGVLVGLDLAGLPEKNSPADLYAQRVEFGEAPLTLHAGETLKSEWQDHIQKAILAGAKRVGHGFNLERNVEATALVCARQIPLEISLTSNKLLGFLPRDDLKTHPFPKYFRAEICGEQRRLEIGHLPVTLNTDDAGIFQTDLTNEFFLAVTNFNLTWDEVKQICRNSLTYAFATEPERLGLLQHWEKEMAESEAAHEPDNFHLKAGKVYEDLHLWKEAESEYLKAGNDISSDARRLALEGLRRVRSHPQRLSVRLTDGLKSFGLTLLVVFGTAVVLYLIALLGLGLYRSSQHMEIRVFTAEGEDKLAREISVTFARLRAVIADTFSSGRIARSGGSGAVNFPVILPSLQEAVPFEEQLPDVEIEVSGIKLSKLTRLIPFLFRPRFRVVGAAMATQYYAKVHAEIWERHRWFDYKLRAVRTRRIPRPPNGDGLVELEVFVYDALLTVMYATY